MRVLIIQKSKPNEASGKVFFQFVEYMATLSFINEIDFVIREDNERSFLDSNSKIRCFPLNVHESYNDLIYKICLIVFKYDVRYRKWLKLVTSFFKKNEFGGYDLVVSLVSGGTGITLNAGDILARRFKTKHFVHLVDPIPPTKGWETYEIFRKSLIYPVRKSLLQADYISSSNSQMLKYQLAQLSIPYNKENNFVLHNPSSLKIIHKNFTESNILRLGFFGTIKTGARNPNVLFAALNKLIENGNDDFEFSLFGFNQNIDLKGYNENLRERVKFRSYIPDIGEVMDNIDVLVDIDGEVEKDVFISSKMFDYLRFNRPIISISGRHSPTSELIRDCTGSIFSNHFDTELLMRTLMVLRDMNLRDLPYDERKALLATIDFRKDVNRAFELIM